MDFQAEEITVQLTLHGGESLSLFRYNATGGVETSEELTEASEVTMSVPCSMDAASSRTFAIART